jgi:hypothetical protein
MAGPMIVPIAQTNGITEYALAVQVSLTHIMQILNPQRHLSLIEMEMLPTFMLWVCDQLSDHSLYHSNVSIEEASEGSS